MQQYRCDVFAGTQVETERVVSPACSAETCATDVVERIRAFEDVRVVGGECAAFPRCQIFPRLKTETGRITNRACASEFMYRAVCLCRVFQQCQRVTLRNIAQCGHVTRLSEEMHSHDGARLAGNDCFFNSSWIEEVSLRIYVDESDAAAPIQHRAATRDE